MRGCFYPGLATRNKASGGSRDLILTYSSMVISALKLGFTTDDMREMPMNMVINFITASNDMNDYEDNDTRDATQADIDRFFG